jgi:hypothetical protein
MGLSVGKKVKLEGASTLMGVTQHGAGVPEPYPMGEAY